MAPLGGEPQFLPDPGLQGPGLRGVLSLDGRLQSDEPGAQPGVGGGEGRDRQIIVLCPGEPGNGTRTISGVDQEGAQGAVLLDQALGGTVPGLGRHAQQGCREAKGAGALGGVYVRGGIAGDEAREFGEDGGNIGLHR